MNRHRVIWMHDVRQARQLACNLTETESMTLAQKVIRLPVLIFNSIGLPRRRRVLRKNLLFTKRLAYQAAKNIHQGQAPAWEMRKIEIKTNEILDKEKKGFYTPKIRHKQLVEIKLLIDHYLKLLAVRSKSYPEMLKKGYPSKGSYLSFLNNLHKAEEEVIQAAISTMRKGSKKERRLWFDKVRQATKQIRMREVETIYSDP